MKLETAIREILASYPPETRFDVIAFELWGNAREGLEVNDAWKIARDADREEVETAARGRWEAFKLNYAPRARVRDIEDLNYSGPEFSALVECAGIPFLEIRPLSDS